MVIKKEKKRKDDRWDAPGAAFVGALMIGIGLGIYYRQTAVGVMIGLGSGFIIMALLRMINRKK